MVGSPFIMVGIDFASLVHPCAAAGLLTNKLKRSRRDSLAYARASLKEKTVQAIMETSQMFIPNFILHLSTKVES